MKTTSRLPRKHAPNTIHHIMMRGNNRQNIFFNEEYFKHLLNILQESTQKFDHKILAYCFMTNHIHLVIYIAETNLSSIMWHINFRYVFWANRKNNRIGHLFQCLY